jgi:hypothetical protein
LSRPPLHGAAVTGRVDLALLYRYGAADPASYRILGVVQAYLIGAAGDPITAQLTIPFRKLGRFQKSMAATGDAYAIVGRQAVVTELASGSLQASRIVSPTIDRTAVLVTTPAKPVTLAMQTIGKLIESLAKTVLLTNARSISGYLTPEPERVACDRP